MEVEQEQNFSLSQVFKVHNRSARTVDARGQFMITGSEDKTVKIFKKQEGGHKYEIQNELDIFEKMIYVVKIRLDGKGFFIGGQDQKITVLDEHGSPVLQLSGHAGTVNSISQIDDNHIATGSWDGTAKIWNFNTGDCVKTFEGHSHAVCVLGSSEMDLLVTGSQDKSLRLFSISSGELKKEVKNAHSDIIRELRLVENVGFLSCSNDQLVNLWSFDGENLSSCQGHSAFVFTVSFLDFGLYVSGGDDRLVKIWNDSESIQNIEHPSTVWNIAINDDKEIISACGDGIIRVFSRFPDRKANEELVKEMENEVQVANQSSQSQQMSQDEINKLPSDINSVKGKKDGEYKMFREGNMVKAYMWTAAEQKWEFVGDVTGTGGGASMGKKYFAGDDYFKAGEYDYVFDVQDDSGMYKQLPYNEGESTYMVARTYCAREGLSFNFQQQIIQFLEQNTRGGQQRTQQAQQQQQQQVIPTKQQKKKELKKSEFFPLGQFFKFTNLNKDAMLKKIKENNEQLQEGDNKAVFIHQVEHKRLDSLVEFIADPSSQAKTLDTAQWDMLTERLVKWPIGLRTPIYDYLRVFVMHPQAEKLFTGLDAGMDILLDICTIIQASETADPIANLLLRLLINSFQISNGRMGLSRNSGFIFDSLKEVLKRENQNVRNSLASLLVNYSIDISQRVQGGQGANISDYVTRVANFAVQFLRLPLNDDSYLKVLVCLGNIVVSAGQIVKSSLQTQISTINIQSNDGKVKQCWEDLKDHINY